MAWFGSLAAAALIPRCGPLLTQKLNKKTDELHRDVGTTVQEDLTELIQIHKWTPH